MQEAVHKSADRGTVCGVQAREEWFVESGLERR